MSNTPSDAEIEKLAAEHLKAFSQFPMGGQVWFEGEVEFARAVLAKWAAPQQEAQEPSRAAKTWCSYVAGIIGCYLNEPDESTKVQAIAGIIERRLWALPTPQPAPDCHHRPPCDECAAIAAQGGK